MSYYEYSQILEGQFLDIGYVHTHRKMLLALLLSFYLYRSLDVKTKIE